MDITMITELRDTYLESAEREAAVSASIDRVAAEIADGTGKGELHAAVARGVNLSGAIARYLAARKNTDQAFVRLRRAIGKVQFQEA